MLYRTNFKLVAPVTDVKEVDKYLKDEDMTKFLLSYNVKTESLRDTVTKIEWNMDDEKSGHIDLITNRPLTDIELKWVSDWVSGQNSDGLGECFEQQSFASYEADPYTGEPLSVFSTLDDDDEPEYVMASFDWETNDYEFTPVMDTLEESLNELKTNQMTI